MLSYFYITVVLSILNRCHIYVHLAAIIYSKVKVKEAVTLMLVHNYQAENPYNRVI